MSFSINSQKATKEELVADIKAQLDAQVQASPEHAADTALAKAAVEAYVSRLNFPAATAYYAAVSGQINSSSANGETEVREIDLSLKVKACD